MFFFLDDTFDCRKTTNIHCSIIMLVSMMNLKKICIVQITNRKSHVIFAILTLVISYY